jgi:hypothetical protein
LIDEKVSHESIGMSATTFGSVTLNLSVADRSDPNIKQSKSLDVK